MHTPTAEQVAIYDAALHTRKNLMVKSYAGCGKSTTLEGMYRALQAATDAGERPPRSSIILAFNKKIAEDMKKRVPASVVVRTFNSLGHIAWMRTLPRSIPITLDDRKTGRIISDLLKGLGGSNDEELWENVRNLVSRGQGAGIVPKKFEHAWRGLRPDTREMWEEVADDAWIDISNGATVDVARAALAISCEEAFKGTISFDDQIYMPLFFGGRFPRFADVGVDEAQDLNLLNHLQIKKIREDRLFVVGDPCQAIYGFRGAASDSMERLRELAPEDSWLDLKLTTTFRCPPEVVARQLSHAPGFNSRKPEGHAIVRELPPFRQWTLQDLPEAHDLAFLCRNVAPLVDVAFLMLKQGVIPNMLGRDIGKNLISLAKKVSGKEKDLPIEDFIPKLEDWYKTEKDLAILNGKEHKLEGLQDRYESIKSVIEAVAPKTVKDLLDAIDELFSRSSSGPVLATIHRSKGLEWTNVVHLDPWRVPSRQAQAVAQRGDGVALQQEMNLRFVAETRTLKNLILADAQNFQGV